MIKKCFSKSASTIFGMSVTAVYSDQLIEKNVKSGINNSSQCIPNTSIVEYENVILSGSAGEIYTSKSLLFV
jgi:hypothetical protein